MKKIVLFTGQHCPTCPGVKSQLLSLADQINIKIEIKSIDEKENAQLAAKFFVSSLPTIIYLEDDRPIHTFSGSSAVIQLRGSLSKELTLA